MRQNDETLAVSFNTAAAVVVQRRVQQNIFARLGVPTGATAPPESLPFHPQDITAGTENELAVTVAGARGAVDLPQAIAQLPFFAAGGRASAGLEKWLAENAGGKTAVLWGTAIDNILAYTIAMPGRGLLTVRRHEFYSLIWEKLVEHPEKFP